MGDVRVKKGFKMTKEGESTSEEEIESVSKRLKLEQEEAEVRREQSLYGDPAATSSNGRQKPIVQIVDFKPYCDKLQKILKSNTNNFNFKLKLIFQQLGPSTIL